MIQRIRCLSHNCFNFRIKVGAMKSKPILLIAAISIIAAIAITSTYNGMSIASAENDQRDGSDTVIPLKEAKLIIEHNAKDHDTGFQGFIDSEGWNMITVTGPDGQVLKFEGKGN